MADSIQHAWKYMKDNEITRPYTKDNYLEITGAWIPDTHSVICGVPRTFHLKPFHRKFLGNGSPHKERYGGFVEAMKHHVAYDAKFHQTDVFTDLCNDVSREFSGDHSSLNRDQRYILSHKVAEYLVSSAIEKSIPGIVEVMQESVSSVDMDDMNLALGETYGFMTHEVMSDIKSIDFSRLSTPEGLFYLNMERYEKAPENGHDSVNKIIEYLVNDSAGSVTDTIRKLEKDIDIDPDKFDFPMG